MMHIHPRHNITNPPGQIVNKIETLGDYIKHVEEQEFPKKKLTFEEWVCINMFNLQSFIDAKIPLPDFEYAKNAYNEEDLEFYRSIWNAAQENK